MVNFPPLGKVSVAAMYLWPLTPLQFGKADRSCLANSTLLNSFCYFTYTLIHMDTTAFSCN